MARQRMYSENVGGNWGLPAGYMEAATAPGRSYAAAISSVGDSVAGAITKYQEDKQAGEIRRAEFEANSEILGRELNDKPGGVTEADVKMIEGLAKYEGANKGAQMAMNESVKVALKKSEREREIQRQEKQQNFVNSFQQQVEARLASGQYNSQNLAGRYFDLAKLNRDDNFNSTMINLGFTKEDRAERLQDRNQTIAALENYGELFKANQNNPYVTKPLTQEFVAAQLAKFKVPPDTLAKISSLAPSQLDLDKFAVSKQNADTQAGYELRNRLRPEHGPTSNKPEVVYDKTSDTYFVKNEKGGWENLKLKPENSFNSFAALSIQKMNSTIEELQRMKINGETKARVDDNGVVHKSSWYRVDEDIDALIQGFKQKMIEARRLTGRRDDSAGGADYTVNEEGNLVPIK